MIVFLMAQVSPAARPKRGRADAGARADAGERPLLLGTDPPGPVGGGFCGFFAGLTSSKLISSDGGGGGAMTFFFGSGIDGGHEITLSRYSQQIRWLYGRWFGKMKDRVPHVQNRNVANAAISTRRGTHQHIYVEMFLIHGV